MFHTQNGLFFKREENGGVTIIKTEDGGEPSGDNVAFEQTLDADSWCSAVLSISAFGERPGDFHGWFRHHKGEEDLLVGNRGGYV